MEAKTLQALKGIVDASMQRRYNVSLDDLEITATPGYWQDKEPKYHKGHPLHGCIGWEGPFRATYTYFDSPRINGRFASRTRTWRALKELNELPTTEQEGCGE